MRKLYLFMMVSLDGYFEGEGHDLSWHNADGEFNGFAREQLEKTGSLLFGKRTYDMMAAFWPTPQGQSVDKTTADAMNTLPKFVAFDTPFSPAWNGTTVLTENVADAVSKLKSEKSKEQRAKSKEQRAKSKDIAILGSNSLCVSLMKRGLVDEFRLMINPRAIGKGTPLFEGLSKKMNFTLRSSRTFKNGNLLNIYTLQ